MENNNQLKNNSNSKVVPMLGPFIMVTFLFSLWGFANDITNPMVAAFKNILLITNLQSALVQFAFYGGYCVMAFPAALFIKRYSYKAGILVGLTLYASGCLLFIPSGGLMAFWAFLISYFIMTCGLSFLETSSNPYILAMGPEETSTRRLNFSQSFNPMGSIIGMLIASQVILVGINPITEDARRHLAGVSKDKTHHQQIYEDSIEAIVASQKILENNDGKPLSNKLETEVKDNIQLAINQLEYMNAELGPKAITLSENLHKAKKNEPSLFYTIRSNFSKDPDAEAAIKALEEQKTILKKEFRGEKAAMDITAMTYQESQALAAIVPDVLTELEPLNDEAIKTLKTLNNKVDAVITALETSDKDSDTNTYIAEINLLLEQSKSSLEQASGKITSIPKEQLTEIYSKAGTELLGIQKADLNVIIGPYTVLGIVVFVVLVIFAVTKLPRTKGEEDNALHIGPTLKRLAANAKYIEGVVAQAFYVGAQIMCWTFIIQYGENELGLEKAQAQNWNILAMAIFVSSRFICTYLLKFVSPGGLLFTLAIGGLSLVCGTIFIQGMTGLYCLVGVSACMSLMFPTIYGIALEGLGDDAKLGAAGLIFAIGGGCLMPPMQGWIMDKSAFDFGFMTLSSTRMSFILPLICFIVIALYGFRTSSIHHKK